MDNMTLLVDEETRDLVFDDEGNFKKIYGNDTTAQNVRHTLITWKAEFFADREHGTAYERIMGVNQNDLEEDEVDEVIREGIFQEPAIARIDELASSYSIERDVTVNATMTLVNDERISMEVTP